MKRELVSDIDRLRLAIDNWGLALVNEMQLLREAIVAINIDRKTEPQTELVNDSPILAKDLVDDEFNPYDEECMRCKHLKLRCEFVTSYCKYESMDEPQTEREDE